MGENDLSVPSTYYFLSKIATRVRNVAFPKTKENLWDMYDVIITTNSELVKTCPKGKTCVLIVKNDNKSYAEKATYSYESLTDAIKENKFTHEKTTKKNSIFNKIKKTIGF